MSGSPENNGLLDSVDARTKLAGSNMMELLLFSLGTPETFGINVFKVREITRTPIITRAPNLPSGVEGVVSASSPRSTGMVWLTMRAYFCQLALRSLVTSKISSG